MRAYKVQIKGKNFLITENQEEKLLGLSATVYIEAKTEEAAFFNATFILNKKMREDGFLKKIINSKSHNHKEKPKLFISDVLTVVNPGKDPTTHYELCAMEAIEDSISWLGWRYFTPERALSEYVLDVGPVKMKDNLPEVAQAFIAWGHKSASLHVLSEQSSLSINKSSALFEKGVREAGFRLPSKQNALRLLVKKYCEWAITDTVSPMAVAEIIGKDIKSMCDENDMELPELSQFEHYNFLLNADWEDKDDAFPDTPNLDKEIIEEAKLYLDNLSSINTDAWIKDAP